MGQKHWLIYGANGYTGTLIAHEAKRRGLDPVLAGRTESAILSLARELECECRIFSLDEFHAIARHLVDIDLVLHCAGPFSATSALMVEACLSSKTHYLDITGEIQVFEHIYSHHERAKAHDIVLCPGVGFDVIPTDCIAAALKIALPDANYLALGFDSRSDLSPGTVKTSLQGLAQGGRIRQDGKVIPVPLAYKVRRIDFGGGEKTALTIPWGDIATAYYTTGIPDIETYMPGSAGMIAGMKVIKPIRSLLAWSPAQNFIKLLIAGRIRKADETRRPNSPTYVWGEVTNSAGQKKTARLKIANGYDFYDITVSGSIEVVKKILNDAPGRGYYTPSQLMGKDFITRLAGCGEIVITDV